MRRLLAPLLERLVEVEMVDRAVALASQAFVALIPLLLVSSAFLPRAERRSSGDALVHRFELDDATAVTVRRVFAQPAEVRSSLSVLGFLLLVVSALSFCRALQRLYERTWRLPSLGMRGTPTQLEWLGLVVVYLSVTGALSTAAGNWLGPVGRLAVALGCGFVLWLWTPYLLLAKRVDRAALRFTAALTATGMTVLGVASLVYMPQAIASSAARFGAIGIAISIVSWLIAAAFVVVVAAALGAVLAERSLNPQAGVRPARAPRRATPRRR